MGKDIKVEIAISARPMPKHSCRLGGASHRQAQRGLSLKPSPPTSNRSPAESSVKSSNPSSTIMSASGVLWTCPLTFCRMENVCTRISLEPFPCVHIRLQSEASRIAEIFVFLCNNTVQGCSCRASASLSNFPPVPPLAMCLYTCCTALCKLSSQCHKEFGPQPVYEVWAGALPAFPTRTLLDWRWVGRTLAAGMCLPQPF